MPTAAFAGPPRPISPLATRPILVPTEMELAAMTPPSSPSPQSGHALRLDILDGNIGLITFDLPNSRANTLGQAVLAEYEKLVSQLEGRKDLRGLILKSGKPGMFV